jgi:hypothetical protein
VSEACLKSFCHHDTEDIQYFVHQRYSFSVFICSAPQPKPRESETTSPTRRNRRIIFPRRSKLLLHFQRNSAAASVCFNIFYNAGSAAALRKHH